MKKTTIETRIRSTNWLDIILVALIWYIAYVVK